MRTLFYVVGSLFIALGLFLSVQVVGDVHGANEAPADIFFSEMRAITPGFVVLVTGLLFVAIGRALELLQQIAQASQNAPGHSLTNSSSSIRRPSTRV